MNDKPWWHETDSQQLLSALLGTSPLGVAVCDRQLRFRAVNDAIASMNGVPPEAHIGKTIHHILGPAAAGIEPAFHHVFATGDPVSNFEVTARLLNRPGTGHWIENYYPIKNASGKVLRVGVIVAEVTKRRDLERSLRRLTSQLQQASKPAKIRGGARQKTNSREVMSTVPLALLNNCISEARKMSELLMPELPLVEMRNPPTIPRPESQEISSGGTSFSPLRLALAAEPRFRRLSPRERQVVQHLAAGRSNKETAGTLNLSIRTVETYRARVMLKLDLRSIAQLVRYALSQHII